MVAERDPARPVRIGAGQGFLGESFELMEAVLADGVEYLVCESLAERTFAILEGERQRDEAAGFARDLPARVRWLAPHLVDRETRLITNAGGANPIAAQRAVIAELRSVGLQGLRVAVVVGDSPGPGVVPRPPSGRLLTANVYIGSAGIVRALEDGADIVITGRVADACLFLAPLVYEWGWPEDDWDRLAAGIVVGHLLECSAQSTGGNYSGDWWHTVDLGRAGLPIAAVAPDGRAIITKPPGTAGQVSYDTVREQLLYEVHDPTRYLTPDVTVDMTSVQVTDLGDDRVEITGVRGEVRPQTLKGLVFSEAGHAGEILVTYAWPDAAAKVRFVLDAVRAAAEREGLPVLEWWTEFFGVDGFGGPTVAFADRPVDPPEVTGRLAWRTADRADAVAVAKLFAPLALTGPPGLHGIGRGGRPREPVPLVAIEEFAVDRSAIEPFVRVHVEKA